MNKFFKIAVMTGAVALGMSSISMASFSDISEGNPYLAAINSLVENKIISGYPDNTFRADGKVTRAEFAKMISVSESLLPNIYNIKVFQDTDSHWAENFIELAASNNLLKGYEDNTFKPNKEITYGEVATILLRTLNIYEIANENMNWPDDCMKYAEKIGLFDGVATNDILGMNPARRDNVAQMIYNKMKLEEIYNSNEKASGDNSLSNDNESAINDNNVTWGENVSDNEENIVENDTKKIYIGTVEKVTKRRGEIYVTVNEFDGTIREIKLNSSITTPEVNTLLLYKIKATGKVELKEKLSVEDTNKDYMLVEEADEELITIKNASELLDLDIDEYVYSGKTIKLNKYTYYLAEMAENEENNYEFEDVTLIERENLKLKKDDRLIFDSKTKIAFIIRGIEV